MSDTYICGAVKTYCMDVATRVTGNDGVTKMRMPKQCRHGCFDLKATELPTASITPEDDDKTVICATRKQGSIVRKC